MTQVDTNVILSIFLRSSVHDTRMLGLRSQTERELTNRID